MNTPLSLFKIELTPCPDCNRTALHAETCVTGKGHPISDNERKTWLIEHSTAMLRKVPPLTLFKFPLDRVVERL
jgi:hypothetical protein